MKASYFFIFICLLGSSVTFGQFAGGSYDGNTMLVDIGCTYSAYNVYAGGSYDGNSNVNDIACVYTAYDIYAGGSYDGFATVTDIGCVYTAYDIYAGGSYDGFATVTDIACAYTAYDIYAGGSYDGFATVTDIACAYVAYDIYSGGSYDGYSTVTDIGCAYTAYNAYAGGSCGGSSISVQPCIGETWTYPTCSTTPYNPPLPIELLYFNATLQPNGSVLCEWETETEVNNDYFIVEKTTNLIDFELVATVNGAGNSNTLLSYTAKDLNPHYGTSYYRLKQVDYNGEYSYSDLRAINLKGLDIINVFPNPSEGHVDVLLYSSVKTTVNISLRNVLGQVVTIANQVEIEEGMTKLHVDVSSFSMGYYMLGVTTESGLYNSQKKLIKK